MKITLPKRTHNLRMEDLKPFGSEWAVCFSKFQVGWWLVKLGSGEDGVRLVTAEYAWIKQGLRMAVKEYEARCGRMYELKKGI